jgi:two-component system nitrate/nitrite response regulator NarL
MLLAGMNADIRVLVLEQGSGLTHDLTLACRRAGIFVLGPVRDVAEAQAAALEMSVDVMVVELSGPSVTVVREAAEVLGGVRILGATDELDPDVGAAVIAAGGTGLLPRTASIAAFVDALRRAAAGELVLPDTHLAALVELVRVQRFDRSEGSKIATLTHREREVVAIALSISVMTVQSHVKNVLAKLGVHSKVEAIRSAWRAGAIALPAGA